MGDVTGAEVEHTTYAPYGRNAVVSGAHTETRLGRGGRIADSITSVDLLVLDELGYRPFAQSGGQLLFHLISKLYERTSIIVTTTLPLPSGPPCSATRR